MRVMNDLTSWLRRHNRAVLSSVVAGLTITLVAWNVSSSGERLRSRITSLPQQGTVKTLDRSENLKSVDEIQVVGEFSNVTFNQDEEDAIGYSVRIWRQGDQMFGLFSIYVGPPSDPPTNILDGVEFDTKTYELSFRTQVSTGRFSGLGKNRIDSHEIVKFRGKMIDRSKAITGRLEIYNSLLKEPTASTEVLLNRSEDLSSQMFKPRSYSEWKSWASEIVNRRPPKT
jgi:hypothetical protein